MKNLILKQFNIQKIFNERETNLIIDFILI